jgi:hypothetical protein
MRYTIEDGPSAVEVEHGDVDMLLVTHALEPQVVELLAELRSVIARARAAAWYTTEFFPIDDDLATSPADDRQVMAHGEHAWLLALAAAAVEAEVYGE